MQTLIGNNVTLKVTGAISTLLSSSGTGYTAPSNGYAIVNVSFKSLSSSSVAIVTVDGQPVVYFYGALSGNVSPKIDALAAASASGASSGNGSIQVFVGPSQALAILTSGSIVYFSGVEFSNSP